MQWLRSQVTLSAWLQIPDLFPGDFASDGSLSGGSLVHVTSTGVAHGLTLHISGKVIEVLLTVLRAPWETLSEAALLLTLHTGCLASSRSEAAVCSPTMQT
jgi:hypothetical protein